MARAAVTGRDESVSEYDPRSALRPSSSSGGLCICFDQFAKPTAEVRGAWQSII
jgi:hypothetical protein